jgi:hypothetical protein
MDTGTSFALLPSAILDALGDSIKGATRQAISKNPGPFDYVWQVPCNAKGPSFSINMKNGGSLGLGSIDYIVSLDPDICVIGFLPTAPSNGIGNALLFGNTFLKKFYTVFDFDNRRIGFTVAKGRTGTTTGPTSTGPNSSTRNSISLGVWIGYLGIILYAYFN